MSVTLSVSGGAFLSMRSSSHVASTRYSMRCRGGKVGSGGQELPPRLGERASRSGDQVTLQKVASDVQQCVTLGYGFDPFGDDEHTHVAAQCGHRSDELLLDRALIDVTYQRHVELHDLRLEQSEATQTGVTCAEIVDRYPEPAFAQPGHRGSNVFDLPQGGTLGDFEHHFVRDRGEGRVAIQQVRVHEIPRMEIHE